MFMIPMPPTTSETEAMASRTPVIADVNAPNIGIKGSDSGWDLAYGVGAQYRFDKAGIRAEYERYDVSNYDKVDLISLGFTYSF